MPGLLRGMARTAAVVGTASAVSGNVQHRQQQKFAQQDQPSQAAPQPAVAAPVLSDADQQMAELEKLGQLKQEGILTQEEFDAKKKQILGL